MLYSEIKERSNRFIIALKIGFPFILLIFLYLFLVRFYGLKDKDILLLTALSLCYVYYIFYLIYSGFKTTLIDNVTKTFNRNHIIDLIKKSKDSTVIMIKITNIHDINDRYGVMFADNILLKFANDLSDFLLQKKYQNVPIGRYSGGYFLVLLNEQESTLKHLFNIFQRLQINNKEDGVEIKINIAMTSVNYDKNPKNIIIHLLNQFEYDENETLLKPDAYDRLIKKSIDNKKFLFSYQPIFDLKHKNIAIYDVLVKLHVDEFGTFTSTQLRQVINRNGYEKNYEINMIDALLEDIKNTDLVQKLVLNISSVILRNNTFLNFIKDKVNQKQIDPKNIILSFYDKKTYEETSRFKEILLLYKNMGFKILIDRFGGDNAGLEYIKWLPIDYVSFDLEFTKFLKNKKHFKILQAYINLLKSLDIKIIVKFIETPYMYESLKKENVDFLQGYMIGKPKTLAKVKR